MNAETKSAAQRICLARYRAVQAVLEALTTFETCDDFICAGLAAFPSEQQDQIVAAMEAQNEFLEEALAGSTALNLFAQITFTEPAASSEEAATNNQQPGTTP